MFFLFLLIINHSISFNLALKSESCTYKNLSSSTMLYPMKTMLTIVTFNCHILLSKTHLKLLNLHYKIKNFYPTGFAQKSKFAHIKKTKKIFSLNSNFFKKEFNVRSVIVTLHSTGTVPLPNCQDSFLWLCASLRDPILIIRDAQPEYEVNLMRMGGGSSGYIDPGNHKAMLSTLLCI